MCRRRGANRRINATSALTFYSNAQQKQLVRHVSIATDGCERGAAVRFRGGLNAVTVETQPSSGLPFTHHPPGSRRRVVTKLPLDGGHGRHRCRRVGGAAAAAASTPARSETTMHVGGGRGSNRMSGDLNLIGVITAAVTPRPSGPSPSMTPPHPRCRLPESCCRKKKT